jgi:hypothetical protein
VLNFTIAALASGAFLDLVLAGVLVEGALLLAYRRWTGRGPAPWAVLANLASGASLMLALRVTLAAGTLPHDAGIVVALCLSIALVAHVADLAGRWDSGPTRAAAAPGAGR